MSQGFLVAFTGHRVQHLNEDQRLGISKRMRTFLLKLKEIHGETLGVISGMALGVDMSAALIASSLGIRWAAYVPFPGQESRWNEQDQKRYRRLLKSAERVFYISETKPDTLGEAAGMLMDRNKAMVDDADMLSGFWTGKRSGGTFSTLKYAASVDRVTMVFLVSDEGDVSEMRGTLDLSPERIKDSRQPDLPGDALAGGMFG